MTVPDATPSPVVEALVNYASPDTPRDKELLRNSDTNTNNFEMCTIPVQIHDVRGEDWEHAYSLDVHGFAMQRAPTTDENLAALRGLDHDYIKTHYYPECVALLKKMTGAGHVVVFNHIVRLSPRDDEPSRARNGSENSKGVPAGLVHVDHSPNCIPPMVPEILPEEEREKLSSRRVQVINIWRPLMEPVQSWPLALGDYRSLHPDDLLHVIARQGETQQRITPTGLFRPRNSHRWHFLGNQKIDEVLYIKTYESRTDVARFAMHTSFDNPLAKDDAPPRESVEIRAVVYYPEE